MAENPDENTMYRDNWVRIDGDMVKYYQQEEFLEKINARGSDLNTTATPS